MGMQTKRRAGRPRQNETDDDLWARLATQFPSLAESDPWAKALTNPHLLAAVVQDAVKVAAPQTRGTRTMPGVEESTALVADLRGEWSTDTFTVAFDQLCGSQSAKGVSARTGLHPQKIIRLRKPRGHPSHLDPTLAEMAAIAAGYRINPMYFAEYRLGMLVAMVANTITPEQTAIYLRRMGGRA